VLVKLRIISDTKQVSNNAYRKVAPPVPDASPPLPLPQNC